MVACSERKLNRRNFMELVALSPFFAEPSELKNSSRAEPLVVLPENARVCDIGRGEARIPVGTEESAGAWWPGSFSSEPGRKTSLHVHFSADEQFYVLEGVLSVWLDGRWLDLPAGSVATAPHRVHHALANRSKQPVRFLSSGNAAGYEKFFADIQAAARQFAYASSEFFAGLAKIYKKYDSELIGPPP
jgi:mannose-6-phosphate isomerase-like protein (cupin superfamily)